MVIRSNSTNPLASATIRTSTPVPPAVYSRAVGRVISCVCDLVCAYESVCSSSESSSYQHRTWYRCSPRQSLVDLRKWGQKVKDQGHAVMKKVTVARCCQSVLRLLHVDKTAHVSSCDDDVSCAVLPVSSGQSLLQQPSARPINEVLLWRILLEPLLLPQGAHDQLITVNLHTARHNDPMTYPGF